MSKDNFLKRKSDQLELTEHSLNNQKKQTFNTDPPNNESSNKNVINKLKSIISTNFDQEISYKQFELEKIDERIFEAQNMLDKLRVCIICNYYSSSGRLNLNEYINHPEIRKLKCEHLDAAINHNSRQDSNLIKEETQTDDNVHKEDLNQLETSSFTKQFNVKVCVGNVSKYLNNEKSSQKLSQSLAMNEGDDSVKSTVESSQYNKDLITHKWMIYLRSPNCAKLENYIKKVVFYLHFSYKPYDVVEVRSPPFQLIRKGWGEFPIRVQLHFKDPRNKRVDINHLLKLDWTQTGLQTFGGETFKDIELAIKPNDFKPELNKVNNSQKQAEPVATNESQTFSAINSPNLGARNPSFDISSSSFISTDIESSTTAFNNFNFPTSSSFDEFIMNFCSNELNSSNSNESKLDETPVEQQNTKPAASASLDELLNLRPKSFLPSALGKLPLQVVRTLKPTTAYVSLSNKPSADQTVTPKNVNLQTSSVLVVPAQPAKPIVPVPSKSFLPMSKKMVIYKVESDDLKNMSEKPTRKLEARTAFDNQNNPIQLTKVKPKTNENEPIETSCSNKPEEKMEIQIETCENNNTERSVYSVHTLIESLDKNKPMSDSSITFESYLKIALKYYPIVLSREYSSMDLQRLKLKYPFCASSMHEFYSWPYAKRKSSEWMRALSIKRKCAHLIKSAKYFDGSQVDLWSTKSIVLWLRSHGYTPLEYKHMVVSTGTKVDDSSEFDYVDSLTPLSRLISIDKYLRFVNKSAWLNEENENNIGDCDEESVLIDIVNEVDDRRVKKLGADGKKLDSSSYTDNLENKLNRIEMCNGSKYIKEQLDMLAFKTSPVEMVALNEKPDEKNTYSCHLVEKFLFALCKRFAEDLIRQTCADIYFDRSKSTAQSKPTENSSKKLNKTENSKTTNQPVLSSDGLQYQKFPETLGVGDIYNTIIKHEKYDFLTNKGMASSEEDESSSSNEIVNSDKKLI